MLPQHILHARPCQQFGNRGALITALGATASRSPVANKPRSYFLPILHVLAIHMKIMSVKPLVSDWCHVSGLWTVEDDIALMVKSDDVPLLLRDPNTGSSPNS